MRVFRIAVPVFVAIRFVFVADGGIALRHEIFVRNLLREVPPELRHREPMDLRLDRIGFPREPQTLVGVFEEFFCEFQYLLPLNTGPTIRERTSFHTLCGADAITFPAENFA
jgi:hypothetical protein